MFKIIQNKNKHFSTNNQQPNNNFCLQSDTIKEEVCLLRIRLHNHIALESLLAHLLLHLLRHRLLQFVANHGQHPDIQFFLRGLPPEQGHDAVELVGLLLASGIFEQFLKIRRHQCSVCVFQFVYY